MIWCFACLLIFSCENARRHTKHEVPKNENHRVAGQWMLDSVWDHGRKVYTFNAEKFILSGDDIQGFIFEKNGDTKAMELSVLSGSEKPLGTYRVEDDKIYVDNKEENAVLDYNFKLENNQLTLKIDDQVFYLSRYKSAYRDSLFAERTKRILDGRIQPLNASN